LIWQIFGLALIAISAVFAQWWLAALGIVIFILSSIPIKRVPSGASVRKTKLKHKLIQAPQEAWEGDEMATFMAMQMGPPIFSDVDMFYPLAESGKAFGTNPLAMGITRRMLPFPNYGESSILQRLFAGLIIPIDSVLFSKTYGYKFGNRKLKGNVNNWVVGGENKIR